MVKKIELNSKDNDFAGTSVDERIFGDGGNDRISGRSGDDKLVGGEGDDRLFGGAGRDTLNGGAGTNAVDGGRGDDIVILAGTRADATISRDGDGWIIGTVLGTTTITNVELFRFSDGTYTEVELEPSYEPDFFLTIVADNFIGTSADDVFLSAGAGTLNSVDVLDGALGNDVLKIGDDEMDPGAAPTLLNIETIEDWDGAGLDLINATGVTRINALTSAAYTNASLATTFAAMWGDDRSISIDYADALTGADDTAVLATSLSAAASVEVDFGADAAGIENITIDVAAIDVGGVSTVKLDADLAGLRTVTVTGAGDAVIVSNGAAHISAATLATFDASTATGDVTTALHGQADVSATFGSGNDSFGGLGTEQGLTVTSSGGSDAVDFADLANIADGSEAGFASDVITIADFRAARDVLDLSAGTIAEITLTKPQQATIEGAATLFAAVTTAAGLAAADEAVVFDYDGNTYVYVEDAAAGFTAGDGLLELVGVSSDDLGGTNLLI